MDLNFSKAFDTESNGKSLVKLKKVSSVTKLKKRQENIYLRGVLPAKRRMTNQFHRTRTRIAYIYHLFQ